MNTKDILFVIMIIFSVVSAMLGLGYIVTLILGFSLNLLLSIPVRLLGFFPIAFGVGFLS